MSSPTRTVVARMPILAPLLLGALLAPAPSMAETELPAERVERALERVYPALVNLTVVNEHYSDGRAIRAPGAGSGVLVTEQGHLLTNFHVAGDSTRITATLTTGEVLEADVVAHDALTDLSVLRLRLDQRPADAAPLRPAELAVEELSVGDAVLAMGNPLTLSSSVTLGIVSNARRVFTDFLGNQLADLDLGDGGPTGLFTQWIQHDALILPGNSGGPLVDAEGRVVGINELGGGGMGFAIPASIARDVLRQALESGRIRRSWLGFSVLPVAKLGLEQGALVASVVPGSPAEHAGLRPGDRLMAIAGEPVTVRFFPEVPDLYRRVSELPIGDPVTLVVDREGERVELRPTTEEMEEARGLQAEVRPLGITGQEVTGPMALVRHLSPRSGVLVTSLRAGFPAAGARPPVETGDLITRVAEVPVTSIEELDRALAERAEGELLIELRRDDERLLSIVKIADSESARRGGELPKPWIGIRTQVVTRELARLLGAPELRGFRVTQVYPWTRAEAAGLRVGDVVVAIDGERPDAERIQDAENLQHAIEVRSIGDTVELDLIRDGEDRNVSLALEARPGSADEARTARQSELEFAVRELTFLDRIEKHWDRDEAGVLVTEVTSGGWAQMAGLQASDLILKIGDHVVGDVRQFEAAMKDVLETRPAVVTFFVRRGWRSHFVFLEPEWPELEPVPKESS